ncbi:MAG: hypothetical protein IJM99_00405, partial [Firmicutes bacterium]|nr:hypothetical protein [Bacillota bacterium]
MSTKNIYLYKFSIERKDNGEEVNVQEYKNILRRIFEQNCQNGSLPLTYEDSEPMVMDILDD